MNIVIAFNEQYCNPSQAMLASFFQHNKGEQHKIYLIYKELSNNAISRIRKMVEKNGSELILYKVDCSKMDNFIISHHFSVETFFPFYITEAVPNVETRALWLDADICVLDSIKEFYNADLMGKYVQGCIESEKTVRESKERLGLHGNSYINSGVVLFNLTEIRKRFSTEDFINLYVNNKEKYIYPDQDTFNVIFDGEILVCDSKYNTVVIDDSCDINTKNIAVLHYIGPCKPWHVRYPYKVANEFRRFYSKVLGIKAIIFDIKVLVYHIFGKKDK